MPGIFASPWFGRGMRLSVVVGLVAAGWHAWTVFQRYNADATGWAETRFAYECAARLPTETLWPDSTDTANKNIRGYCSDRDFYVSMGELQMVREGTLKFEALSKPTDWEGAAFVGALWMAATMLATILILSLFALVRWVWGKP